LNPVGRPLKYKWGGIRKALDRRRERRAAKKLYVSLSDGSITAQGLLGDFSENGLFISSIQDFAMSTEIAIEIFMPDRNNSFLRGVVRRKLELTDSHRKNGLGIELTRKDRRYIDFIASEELGEKTEQKITV
jgi:hypothetical protein